MSRYFMTIPEACQLILQASALGQGGEIFALDMGEPIKIRDLAEQMIRLGGKQPGTEVPIIYTGLRPGEKLFEELFHPQENYSATTHAKIFLARSRSVAWEVLAMRIEKSRGAVEAFDVGALREQVSALLPAFCWSKGGATDNVVPLHQNRNEGAA
jgi:FlaA1/EpsC-like NDP-sugar epimerase